MLTDPLFWFGIVGPALLLTIAFLYFLWIGTKRGSVFDSPDSVRIRFRTYGAGDEIRTRDIFLGKEVLYQLSYARFPIN